MVRSRRYITGDVLQLTARVAPSFRKNSQAPHHYRISRRVYAANSFPTAGHMMISATEQFRDAIQSAGLVAPNEIEPDGKLKRFSSNGKKSDDSGWYVLHGDSIAAGSFGDWRTGISQSWRADIGRALSPQEEIAHRARIEGIHREREAEDARRHEAARRDATALGGRG